MGEETTIMGTVLSVVFQNEENGYAVLRLVTDDGELLTLVGCVPCAAPGENLTATGSFSSHPQYGEQFSASEVERYLPSNETEILNYLASGVVRGVGPATAEKLVARFGIETLQVLESEPEKLTAIKGMTARRAQEISAAFNEQMGLRRVMEFLAHYDLPAALSVPLYRRFGANAMAALERNPYLLSDSAFGVDFSVCDEIALSMGFGGDASLRTEAGLTFELSHNRDAGGHDGFFRGAQMHLRQLRQNGFARGQYPADSCLAENPGRPVRRLSGVSRSRLLHGAALGAGTQSLYAITPTVYHHSRSNHEFNTHRS